MTDERRRGRRLIFFLGCCLAGIIAVTAYVAVGQRGPGTGSRVTPRLPIVETGHVPAGPLLMFRSIAAGDLYGRVAMVPLPVAADTRTFAPLSCERLHYAAGHGVCLVVEESLPSVRYLAYTFDDSFRRGPAIELTGPPVRARVAADGRRAAVTVFERGHSYADAEFSTRTTVIDTGAGRAIADLEDFAIDKDGVPFKAVDFNFWGLTFARDGDTFFATLKTKGQRYLVKGSVDARRASVVRADIECPSLSPDGTQIVFKKPLVGEIGWRLHVLDLASGIERPLNQVRRSVDDQVDWFDDQHVVYHDSATEGTGVWMLSTDGVTPPQLLVADAYSPVVVR